MKVEQEEEREIKRKRKGCKEMGEGRSGGEEKLKGIGRKRKKEGIWMNRR